MFYNNKVIVVTFENDKLISLTVDIYIFEAQILSFEFAIKIWKEYNGSLKNQLIPTII